MVNYIDRLYTGITDKHIVLVKLKFYSIQRLLIRLGSNIIIPLYYRFHKRKHFLSVNNSSSPKYIVSLTSFPVRIGRVWIVIESILRQTHKPDKIILWLSGEQFDSYEKLPKSLLKQQKRGLEIRLVKGDIKSHKKYLYAIKKFPNDFLITVDDDIIYPTTLLSQLIDLNKKYPKSICCHRASAITYLNNQVDIETYHLWKEIKSFKSPSFNTFFTTGGGTLFPPNSLHNEVFNENIFKKHCFFADDIWLNIMSRLCLTTVVRSDYHSSLLPVLNYKNINLYERNLIFSENDKQLRDVRNYYIKKLNIDAFNLESVNSQG